MHFFPGTDNRIDGTGLNASGAADAFVFAYHGVCDGLCYFLHIVFKRCWILVGDGGNLAECFNAAGFAAVDALAIVYDRFCVGQATFVSAELALGLRKNGVDTVDDFLHFYYFVVVKDSISSGATRCIKGLNFSML